MFFLGGVELSFKAQLALAIKVLALSYLEPSRPVSQYIKPIQCSQGHSR
jgi:hypothetical protein